MRIKSKTFLLSVYYLSGISGLVYQVVWLRLISGIFGNTTYAISTVLAAFMAGLAIGSWQGGKYIGKSKSPINFYVILEIGIALSAIVITTLLVNFHDWYSPVYQYLSAHLTFLTISQFILGFLLIFAPTAFMGATVPTMARIVITNMKTIGNDFSLLYALNTLGGMTGVILSSFYLIEHVGLYWTLTFAVSLNLLIGLTVFLKFKKPENQTLRVESEPHNTTSSTPTGNSNPSTVVVVAFLTGFFAFGLEILWTRSLVFYIGNTTYSFALILLFILFGIAIGSLVIQRISDYLTNKWIWISSTLVVIGIGTFASIPLVHYVFSLQLFEPARSSWFIYLLQNSLKTSLVVLIASIGMGITFPLLNTLFVGSIQAAGRKIGTLYAWNTFGSILGSLITGFILVPGFGITSSMMAFVILIFATAAISWTRTTSFSVRRRSISLASISIGFSGLFILSLTADVYPFFQSHDEKDMAEVIYYEEGLSATTTVYLNNNGDKKMTVDGVLMGGDFQKAMRKQLILADLPLLFRPNAENIYVVGLGTGITFEEFHKQKPDAQVVCAEISESVITGSKHFQALSTHVNTTPNVHLLYEDGKNFLKHYKGKLDIISSDTMLKKGSAGNSVMYSKEYYELCRDKLSEDGLFIQWVPLYLGGSIHRIVLNTIRDVFPHTTLWYVGDEALVHISSITPLQLEYGKLQETFKEKRLYQSFQSIGIEDIESILSTFIAHDNKIDEMIDIDRVNSMVHPVVEFKAPRELAENTYGLVIENLERLIKHSTSLTHAPDVLTQNLEKQGLMESLNGYHQRFKSIMQGLIYSYSGQVKLAKSYLSQALAANPDDSNARYYLGLSSAYSDDSQKARNYLETGIVLREQGLDSLAVDAIIRSLDIESNNLLAMNELSLLYARNGYLDHAISVTEQMIAIKPDESTFYFNLGYYQEQQRDTTQALSLYEKALSLNPGNQQIKTRLQLLQNSGQSQ